MSRRFIALVACVALATFVSSRFVSAQDTPAQIDPAVLKELAWISGTWTKSEGGVVVEEHWRPLQGTTLLGSSHTYDAEQTRFFEHLRISARRGALVYIAQPGGAPPTAFSLARHGKGPEGALVGSFVEFENAEHDHPQRIRYERTEAGLTATIGQLDGSRQLAFVFQKAQ